jgi:lipopolysaccharide transport system permease protein
MVNHKANTSVTGREDDVDWTIIISPQHSWLIFNFKEVWQYRDLVKLFVRRDFVAKYKQTILGPLWFVLQPLLTTLVFIIIFGRIAKISTDGLPEILFYFSGTICWGYFADCFTQIAETFIANAPVFGKVYFPRLVVPIANAINNMFKFFIQFAVFILLLIFYHVKGFDVTPSLWLLTFPLLLVQMAAMGIACGLIVSSISTRYRDLTNIMSVGVQLWMLATPVVYPLSQVPENYRRFFILNPMASIISGFRAAFLGKSVITVEYFLVGWIVTLICLFCGLVLFNRIEKTFVDTI